LLQRFGQAVFVDIRLTGQGKAHIGVAAIVDQLQAQAGLLHLPGLTHLALVEADKFRGFAGIAQGELLGRADRLAQPLDQRLELPGLTQWGTHQASPPNTSI